MPLLKRMNSMSLCTMKEQGPTTKMYNMPFPLPGKKSFGIPVRRKAKRNNRGLVLGKRVCGRKVRKPFFTTFLLQVILYILSPKNSYRMNIKLTICISILMQLLLAGLKTAAQNHIQPVQFHKSISNNSKSSVPGGTMKTIFSIFKS
jgi:hypothetical protein